MVFSFGLLGKARRQKKNSRVSGATT